VPSARAGEDGGLVAARHTERGASTINL
jgi:hypothetical protein